MTRTALFSLPLCLLLSGCMTYQTQQQALRTRQTEDQLIQQESQRRLSGRIETLEMEISRISREVDSLRQSLDSRFASIEQKIEEDKRQMISQLSAQMEKLIRQAAPAPAPASSSSGSAYGYEHIVQPGETLSAIAKAYNVTTQAIISANKIKNPNRLSVGQKLFIPE